MTTQTTKPVRPIPGFSNLVEHFREMQARVVTVTFTLVITDVVGGSNARITRFTLTEANRDVISSACGWVMTEYGVEVHGSRARQGKWTGFKNDELFELFRED